MLKPTSSEIQSYAADYSMIPLCREIYADVTTPIALLRKIAQVSNRYCLLESVEGGERWGRYSFLGYDPLVHIVCKDHVVTTEYADGRRESVTTDQPNDILRALMAQYKAPRIEGFPPFTGGLVGYYAYRMIGYAERCIRRFYCTDHRVHCDRHQGAGSGCSSGSTGHGRHVLINNRFAV